MARRTLSIDEKIEKAQEHVARTKERYDSALEELKLLLDKKELELVYRLRKVLSEMNLVESVELLKSRLAKFKTNAEFLMSMSID